MARRRAGTLARLYYWSHAHIRDIRNRNMKSIFRFFLSFFVWLYQRTGGKFGGSMQGLRVLLLTTTGRRTGKTRLTPLGSFEYDGCYVITASNSGSDHYPGWYFNLKNQPQVSIQIGDKHIRVRAEQAQAELRQQLWAELVRRSPGYGAYQTRTTRIIPIFLLRPVAAS